MHTATVPWAYEIPETAPVTRPTRKCSRCGCKLANDQLAKLCSPCQHATGNVMPAGKGAKGRKAKTRAVILRVIRARGRATTNEIAAEVNCAHSTAKQNLKAMYDDGLLDRKKTYSEMAGNYTFYYWEKEAAGGKD